MIAHRANILMFVRTFPLPGTRDFEAPPAGDERCRKHPISLAQFEMEDDRHVSPTPYGREVPHVREMAAS